MDDLVGDLDLDVFPFFLLQQAQMFRPSASLCCGVVSSWVVVVAVVVVPLGLRSSISVLELSSDRRTAWVTVEVEVISETAKDISVPPVDPLTLDGVLVLLPDEDDTGRETGLVVEWSVVCWLCFPLTRPSDLE